MTNHKTSLWKLLSKQAVCIPIIQRDYAQGREGKEYLRQKFLKEFLSALNAKDTSGFLTLDFVYGAEADSAILPLDGQQRLTTLWLIHWYLAFRLNLLTTENGISEIGETLQRFSYETRISSREFCRQLCTLRQPSEEELKSGSHSLLNFIRSQTWFYTAWNQDPTIQAMLRMLNGTDKKDVHTNEDITDGIDELLGGHPDLWASYWRKLTSDNQCPVMFYKMTIGSEQLPMTDELYIKMNARGKALTDFENFKADLIEWIYQDEHSGLITDDPDTVSEHQAMYASLLDNGWMDIFWELHTPDGKVDEIYFAFLNRYFFNEAVLMSESMAKLQESPIWKLYGDKSDDTRIAYTGFEFYSEILQSSNKLLLRLKTLFRNLELHQLHICESLPGWALKKSNTFHFIPAYEKDNRSGKLVTIQNEADRTINKVTSLTQEQRVLFLAVTKYFEKNRFDEISFSRWIRVASNLIENPKISTIEDMIGRMRLINELSEHIDDLYYFLADDWKKIKSNASSEQLWEEHEKCLKITHSCNHSVDTGNDAEYWATAIIEMENFAFFNGAIRFLFMNEEGAVDWSFFPTKAKYATLMFNEKGLSSGYSKDAKANRVIISHCNDWGAQIESWTRNNKYIFSYDSETWRNNILLKKGSRDYSLLYDLPVHKLLTGNDINYTAVIDPDYNRQLAFNRLVATDVIAKVLEWKKSDIYYIRKTYDNLCLYPSSEGVILTLLNRDIVLSELLHRNLITLDWDRALNTENAPIFIGWNIFFNCSYHDEIYQFRWSHWNTVYMCKDFKRLIDCDSKYMQEDFSIDGNLNCEEIVAGMNSCIRKYKQIETDIRDL